METVIPIARIEAEAAEAARLYSDINAACPYPWHTDAAHQFKAFFYQARQQLQAGASAPEANP